MTAYFPSLTPTPLTYARKEASIPWLVRAKNPPRSPGYPLRGQAVRENSGSDLLGCMRQEVSALYQHSLLVWMLSYRLTAQLPMSSEERLTIAQAALLHDVGKLALPRPLVEKPTALTEQEWILMQQHCTWGAALLRERRIDERVVRLVLHHHERWDGEGYPQRLSGEAIPRSLTHTWCGCTSRKIRLSFQATSPHQPADKFQMANI